LTVGAAAPLQAAGTVALGLPERYYGDLVAAYRTRRDRLVASLDAAGLRPTRPDGAYYVMTDLSGITADDEVTFARRLVTQAGVAAVPGSSFYHDPALGRRRLRFAFPKRAETLAAAAERLASLSSAQGTATPAGVREMSG
jgi:aminotransferase